MFSGSFGCDEGARVVVFLWGLWWWWWWCLSVGMWLNAAGLSPFGRHSIHRDSVSLQNLGENEQEAACVQFVVDPAASQEGPVRTRLEFNPILHSHWYFICCFKLSTRATIIFFIMLYIYYSNHVGEKCHKIISPYQAPDQCQNSKQLSVYFFSKSKCPGRAMGIQPPPSLMISPGSTRTPSPGKLCARSLCRRAGPPPPAAGIGSCGINEASLWLFRGQPWEALHPWRSELFFVHAGTE